MGASLPAVATSPGIGASAAGLAAARGGAITPASAGASSLLTFANLSRAVGFAAKGFGTVSGFQDLRAQADLSSIQAERERIKGIEQGNQITEDLIRNLARNRALIASSGLQALGSFDNVNEELVRDADRQLSISRNNAFTAAETKRIQAASLDRRATGKLVGGGLDITSSLLNLNA